MNSIERNRIIISYLEENEELFNDYTKSLILENMDKDVGFGTPGVVLQLYDELGILEDKENPYKAFVDLIDAQFDIKNKNIIEIGGGVIPRLGKRIARMQNCGTIIVYDPNLCTTESKISNMKLVNRRFYSVTNVDKADLLVGLLPCGSSSTIVKSAIRHNKDFMIAVCDSCNSLEFFDGYDELDEEWPNDFILRTKEMVEDNNMGQLKKVYMKEIGEQYPIIYNDRR